MTEEQIQNAYKQLGVDSTKFTELGEMNIIVQMFGCSEDDDKNIVEYLNYMPRKERCCFNEVDLSDTNERQNLIKQLRNSAERMKIFAYLLAKQADEIESIGYPKTSCYYPEFSKHDNFEIKQI